jgi:hypothetical protein
VRNAGRSFTSRTRAPRNVPDGARIFQRIYTRLGLQGRPPRFVVVFHPYSALSHSVRLHEDAAVVRLSDALEKASRSVLEAVAAILLARLYGRRTPRQFLEEYRRFLHAAPTRRKLAALRRKRSSRPIRVHGEWHDLRQLFAELNGRYFAGRLEAPRLGWSTRAWRAQLGCFDPALRTILINRRLDDASVPRYVVGYVLYHEMLHMKHPLRREQCRLRAHSAEFRAEEKQFHEYDRAVKFLERTWRHQE